MHRLLLFVLVAGCASVQPPRVEIVTETVEVKVPVPVSCVREMPTRPVTQSDREILALDDYGAVLALRRRDLQLQYYTAELEAVLEVCRR